MAMSRLFLAVSLACALSLVAASPAGAQSTAAGAQAAAPGAGERDWLRGLAFVLLDSADEIALRQARGVIQAQGGRIALMSPPSTLVGWIPRELHRDLIGQAHIAAIHDREIDSGQVAAWDPATRAMATWFNEAITGRYQQRMAAEITKSPPPAPEGMRSDVLEREPMDLQGILQNLRAQGLDTDLLSKQGLLELDKGNSDTMAGTVAVTLFFVESNGTGADPNLYTWTDSAVQEYLAGVNTGLAWWTTKAAEFSDCWVAFLVRWFPPTDPRCAQWREMVLHPSADVGGMVSDVMANFGYSGGNHLTRVDAFNTAERLLRGTDRSYSAFVAYNPSPAADQLTNGTSAFAYLLGPYTFLLYRSYSWRPDQVFTHESGHIFGACDEYADGCACAGSCTNGVPNQNCENCAQSGPCMMKYNSFGLCQYTDGHVGWRYSPCAPAPLPAPTFTAMTPASALVGSTLDVTVTGTDFVWGATLDMGPDITVNSTSVLNDHSMTANITLASVAAPGPRSVAVINRDLQESAVVAGAFQVIPTPRHYVSTSGSGVFPYVTPQTAATTLAAVLNAAGPGDSVLVEAGVIALGDLHITRALHLIGGWSPGFVAQGAGGARTSLQLTTAIRVTGGATLESFAMSGGTGRQVFTPAEGRFGGAVSNQGGLLTLVDCELHSNQAVFATTQIGAGGAVHVLNSDLVLRDCMIRDNRSYGGGGLYLETSTALLERVTFLRNSVEEPFVGNQRGGAIHAVNCSTLTLIDVVLDSNRSQADGGGLFLSGCGDVQILGGSLVANHAGSQGGGLEIRGSSVVIDAAQLQGNSAPSAGGAVSSDATSQLSVRFSTLTNNSALLGAGIAATSGSVNLEHNLFVGQQATASGSAAYLTGVSTGAIVGNTLDANLCTGAGGAALLLVSSGLPVFDNIIVRSDDVGILCAASPSPTLHHNLVWGSTGADYGSCGAGTGALSSDPLFVDAVGGDYHLALHSPAIDAGDPGASYNDADGSRGDLGMYGSSSRPLDQPAAPQGLEAWGTDIGVRVRWQANAEPDIAQYALYGSATSGFTPGPATLLLLLPASQTEVEQFFPGDPEYYRVSAVDADGYASGYSAEVVLRVTGAPPTPAAVATRLLQNVPNPFNPATTIGYSLRERSAVTLTVYDVMGARVRALVDEVMPAGTHQAVWDGRDGKGRAVPSGVYFYRLRATGYDATHRMVLLK